MARGFSKSLRWQIQAWHGALLLLTTSVLLSFFWGYERQQQLTRVDDQLQSILVRALPATQFHRGPAGGPPRWEADPARRLGDAIFPSDPAERRGGPPPPPARERPETAQAWSYLRELESTQTYLISLNANQQEIFRTANAPATVPPPEQRGEEGAGQFRTREGFRELLHFRPRGDVLVVGTSITGMKAALQKLAFTLCGLGAAVVGLGLLGGGWLTSRALRPIAEISATAERIAEGDLTQRIPTHEASSELGRLATVLNHTFERLQSAFDQQAQFTADASHELRTPISVILAQTELALMRERSPAEYRQALESCQRSGEQMKTLVNAMLELARMDAGDFHLQPTRHDLAGLIREVVQLVAPLAEQRQHRLFAELPSVMARVDDEAMRTVLTNLLINAIKHNPPGRVVRVLLAVEAAELVIRVVDDGVGIAPELLPKIFDRFVRADAARTRAEGSTGLGLSICQAIVQAHGGTLTASSAEGLGSEFMVRLPHEPGTTNLSAT